jgi:hypothetical protein
MGRYAIEPDVFLDERYDIELAIKPHTKKQIAGSRYADGISGSIEYNAPKRISPASVTPVTYW